MRFSILVRMGEYGRLDIVELYWCLFSWDLVFRKANVNKCDFDAAVVDISAFGTRIPYGAYGTNLR